jgi:hypothetical protein
MEKGKKNKDFQLAPAAHPDNSSHSPSRHLPFTLAILEFTNTF